MTYRLQIQRSCMQRRPLVSDCKIVNLKLVQEKEQQNGNSLAECLSVTQKNICSARPHCKTAHSPEVLKWQDDCRPRMQCLRSSVSNRIKLLSSISSEESLAVRSQNCHDDIQAGETDRKSIQVSKPKRSSRIADGSNNHEKSNEICEEKDQHATLPIRDVSSRNVKSSTESSQSASSNTKLPVFRHESKRLRSTTFMLKTAVVPIVPPTKHANEKIWTPGCKTSQGFRGSSTTSGNSKTSFYRAGTLNITSEPPRSAKRATGPRLGMRCKTSMGHHPASSESQQMRSTKSAGFLRHRSDLVRQDTIVGDTDIPVLADRLDSHVVQNRFQQFEATVRSWDMTTRQRVVNYKPDPSSSSSVFFRACQLSRLPFVELMLRECSPNLEQTGAFTVPDDDTVFQVTPLWYAAVRGVLDLVRLLTSFGANVNATSSTGSSVVKAACCMSHVAIVSFLIAHGSDIHMTNKHGVSCLMNAVLSPQLISLLVHHGARVNQSDLEGNTALHYAAGAGELSTVKLLVELGANSMIANTENCNVIQTAAKHRHKQIVEYLLEVAAPRVGDIVNVYSILAAMTILADHDYSSGLFYWYKALNLNRINSSRSPRKPHQVSALADFVHAQEVATKDELSTISFDYDALCLQALLMYERIGGQSSESYLNLLVYRGAVSADEGNLRLAVNLWKTAYYLQLKKYVHVDTCNKYFDIFSQDMMRTLTFLVRALYQISKIFISENQDGKEQLKIPEAAVRNLFRSVCHHISRAHNELKQIQTDTKSSRSFAFLLKSCLCFFLGYLQLFKPTERSPLFGKHLRNLLMLNPKGTDGGTLVHMCLDMPTWVLLEDEPVKCFVLWPIHGMLEIMLLLGADPIAGDIHGNTALHLAMNLRSKGVALQPDTLPMLLRLGTHVDQVNHYGQTAADLLSPDDELRNILQQQTCLKCLAARVVVCHRIPYVGEVPVSLYSYIQLHRAGLDMLKGRGGGLTR